MSRTLPSAVADAQRTWANRRGHLLDERGYLNDVSANLFAGLSLAVRAAFEKADGAELRDGKNRPAKMRSVISSSTLALNVFQQWTRADAAPLAQALGLSASLATVQFEWRMRTGAGGTPPNLDVVLTTVEGGLIGIESKFTEWMTAKSGQSKSLAPYHRKATSLWDAAGLDRCARLAFQIHKSEQTFVHLDAPQLLKHALGLHRAGAPSWSLHYVWYDAGVDVGSRHAEELDRFANLVGDELHFRPMSYQALVSQLRRQKAIDDDHFGYLHQRYGLGGAENT